MSEEEAKPRRAMAMPTKKAPSSKPMLRAAIPPKGVTKKVNTKNVKGKIAAMQDQMRKNKKSVAALYSDVRVMKSGIREQTKENQEAVAKIEVGVRAIQSGIKEQTNKFKEGAADMQAGAAAIMSGIAEQMKENRDYTRKFYG